MYYVAALHLFDGLDAKAAEVTAAALHVSEDMADSWVIRCVAIHAAAGAGGDAPFGQAEAEADDDR